MKFPAKSEGSGGGGGVDFIKMKDGDVIEGCFIGEPIDYKEHFNAGLCDGENCASCMAGDKPGFKFRINFIMQENKVLTSKIFQQGWKVYCALAALAETYEKDGVDIQRQKFRIKRIGSKKEDTVYQIIPIPNGIMPDAVFHLVKQVPLKDLTIGLKKREPTEVLVERAIRETEPDYAAAFMAEPDDPGPSNF